MNIVRQAIVTKYLPATNYKPSRIKASCDAGSITISYPHELEPVEAHASVAIELHHKLGWDEKNMLVVGGLPDSCSHGYVFVQLERKG